MLDVDRIPMSTEIANKDDLVQVLVMPVEVETIKIKAVLQDLMVTLKLNPRSVVTYNHLLLFLTLMDSTGDLWTRVVK